VAARVHHQLFRPAVEDAASLGWVSLSFDEERLAYAVKNDAGYQDLFVAPVGSDRAMRLVEGDDFLPTEMAWSPLGEHVAYKVGDITPHGGGQTIGVCKSGQPGEMAVIPGLAFVWMPAGRRLLVADYEARALVEVEPTGKLVRKLASIHTDRDSHFPPTLAVSQDGQRIAYVCRRLREEVAELWIIDGRGPGRPVLLAEFPGASLRMQPFWSPDGDSLGFLLVDLAAGTSGIVTVPGLEGEGEVVYGSALIDLPVAPLWLPAGRHVAFFRAARADHEFTANGPQELGLLDLDSREIEALSEPDEFQGHLRLSRRGGLISDGLGAAHRIGLEGV
jgi:dipeptidyl aminopeptidase/acylaminoacyl peptidase